MSIATLLALGNGAPLLPFFTTRDAHVLMLISKAFALAVRAYPWHDTATRVRDIARWRQALPNATACLVAVPFSIRSMPARDIEQLRGLRWIKFASSGAHFPSDCLRLFAETESIDIAAAQWKDHGADPRELRRVRELTINCNLTDAHLAHLCAVRKLHVRGCLQITDSGLQHLKLVRSLELSWPYCGGQPSVPDDPTVLTDAALVGLPIERLHLAGLVCRFSPAGFAQLPLRSLVLQTVPHIEIGAGQLASLVNLSFLHISNCPRVELGDEDICGMLKLTQLVLERCPRVRITSGGILQLVTAQIERGGPLLELLEEPEQFEFRDPAPLQDHPEWPSYVLTPFSLYNKRERKRIKAARQACAGISQTRHLFQVEIEECPQVAFTLEEREALTHLAPYVGIEPWRFDDEWVNTEEWYYSDDSDDGSGAAAAP